MKKTRATILSLLLVLALLLPMAPAAHAATTVFATDVKVSAPDSKVYYRDGQAGVITVTATIAPSNYNGLITWELDNAKAFTVVGGSLGASNNRMIKLQATGKSLGTTVHVSATVEKSASEKLTHSYSIDLVADAVATCTLSPANLNVEVGKTAKLTATAAYLSGSGTPTVTYKSDNPAIATVSTNGVVTGVSRGSARITATAGNVTSQPIIVEVIAPTSSVTGSTSIGAKYSMQDIYDSLLLQYNNVFHTIPTTLTFTNLTKNCGILRTGSGAEVTTSPKQYNFTELRAMYLEASASGTYTFNYEISDGAGYVLSGNGTITVTTPVKHIRVPVSGSTNYSFGDVCADGSGKTGAILIRETLGSFGSIKFGTVLAGDRLGTLYTSANAGYNDLVGNGTIVAANAVDALFFTPAAAGAYSIAYEAWSGANATGVLICSGNLIIPVDSAGLDLAINLDTVSPYSFSTALSTTTSSGVVSTASAAAQLINVIGGAVGTSEWNGVRFTAASAAASQIGALYPSIGAATVVNADTYIDFLSLQNLYFVPSRTGTYEITYSVYTDKNSTTPLASGKLTINVSNVPTGNPDFIYTMQAGATTALKESDFLQFFQNKYSGRYFLSYVIFDEFNGDGTFNYDSQRFIPRNSPACYTSTYNGTLPASPHYLDRLSFTAPTVSGITAVKFTCYGGTSANSGNVKISGVLHIYYTSTEVPSVNYNAYNVNSVVFAEADFIPAYRAATNSTAANPSFEIRLLNVPNYGTLYRYYSRTGSTTLNYSNVTTYTFTVNGTDADSISKVEFKPNSWQAGGIDTINYLAFAPNGSVLYSGTIRLKLAADRTASVYSDGLSFQVTDFYKSNDSDPVLYVTFKQPTAGRVYAYDPVAKRYVSTTPEKTRFYTISTTDGEYAITNALYVPKAGQTGTVQLVCVAHRRSGATYEDTIIVSAINKTASTVFADVGIDMSWAANAVDFSRRLGLVGGFPDGAFRPRNTMLRGDFVLILYRLAGSPSVNAMMPYTDVPAPTDSYSTEIYNSAMWAYSNGVMRNIADGTKYEPKTNLTRQDFAQILFNYTKAMGGNVANNGNINSYSDANQVSANTREGVIWAVANGYITSTTSGLTIEPARAATRAEIVTLLHRYLTY